MMAINLCWTPSNEFVRYFTDMVKQEQHCYLDGYRWTWRSHWFDGQVDVAWVRKHGKREK